MGAAMIRLVPRQAACTATDFLARRTRLAFLDQKAALEALPKVIRLLGEVLEWDEARRNEEQAAFRKYLGRARELEPVAAPAD